MHPGHGLEGTPADPRASTKQPSGIGIFHALLSLDSESSWVTVPGPSPDRACRSTDDDECHTVGGSDSDSELSRFPGRAAGGCPKTRVCGHGLSGGGQAGAGKTKLRAGTAIEFNWFYF